MANNFVQEGKVLHYIPQEGEEIKSGDLVAVNDVAGIAITDGVPGYKLAVSVDGVYAVPVPASVGNISQGRKVYYDTDAKEISLDDENLFIGWAWEDGAPGESVPIKLAF